MHGQVNTRVISLVKQNLILSKMEVVTSAALPVQAPTNVDASRWYILQIFPRGKVPMNTLSNEPFALTWSLEVYQSSSHLDSIHDVI